jgi:hypothetical protein
MRTRTGTKAKTAAFRKVDEFRDAMHPGATKVQAKDLSCTVYLYDSPLGPAAAFYRGRAKRPAQRYRYRSEAKRAEAVAGWMAFVQESQRKRAQRTRRPRELGTGDVLMAMWGYEQTNVDYYKVVRLVGKASVELVKIGSKTEATGWLQGKCIPDPDNVISEPFRRRVDGDSVRISSVARAYRQKPRELPGGVRVYDAHHYSSYH